MKKGFIYYIFIGVVNLFYFLPAQCFVVDQYDSCTLRENILAPLPLKAIFSLAKPQFKSIAVDTHPLHLRKIVEDMLLYFKKVGTAQRHYTQPKEFTNKYLSLKKIQQTLRFVKKTIDEDEFFERKYRILDPKFIQKNFGFFAWTPDLKSARKKGLDRGKILLTCYTVYKIQGSPKKTTTYDCALYGLEESVGAPICTKQQVLAGVFEDKVYKGLVKPLVWVTRDGLEESLMQGSVFITMPNGKTRSFSVHKNNGIPYERNNVDRNDQKRYWFFKERGHAEATDFYNKCSARKNVVFAGDITAVGLGKIIMVKKQDPKTGKIIIQLGVLADTGGAFKGNLYQLDQFVGICTEKQKRSFHAQAYILYKK